MAQSYLFLLLVSVAIASACGPNGGTEMPPSTFTDFAFTDGYEGEANGYIAGYPLKITYAVHKVQGSQLEPQNKLSLLSTAYKTGKETYKGHPKIVKKDELKDHGKA